MRADRRAFAASPHDGAPKLNAVDTVARPSTRAVFAIAATFAALVLFLALRMPMSYDDAFNASVPLNLARGNGYPFDVDISSGAAFLAPAAVPIALFGAAMQWPMLYTAALCLTLYFCLLHSLHRHAPAAALATAILTPFTLWQGKTDVVATIAALPASPFGYWYQLLGNLPGSLALALAMSLLLEGATLTRKRLFVVPLLMAFAVNAKIMHIVPLAGMLAMWVVLPLGDDEATPGRKGRLLRLGVAAALVAAGWFGLCFNRLLAWLFLDGETFRTFVDQETSFAHARAGLTELRSTPLAALPLVLAKSLGWNALRTVKYLGGALQGTVLIAGMAAAAAAAWGSAKQSSLARLVLVLIAGVAAHLAWWGSLAYAPPRQLTPVQILLSVALGCAVGLYWLDGADGSDRRRNGLAWIALALLCMAGVPNLVAALRGWNALTEHRKDQVAAAAALRRLADEYPDARFCTDGWYVPRELTYLAPPGIRYCDLRAVPGGAPGRRILMLATNLWPTHKASVRAADARCATPLEKVGRFEFRACDGFGPATAGRAGAAPFTRLPGGGATQNR